MVAASLLIALILGAGVAWIFRVRLQTLSWTTFAGVALTGAGAPVLLGQVLAMALAETAAVKAENCEAQGAPCPEVAMLYVALPLMVGLCCGLAFVFSAIAMRFLQRV